MKALFLIFHGFDESNGISKKIRYQVKALKDCGLDTQICWFDDTYPDGQWCWMIENRILVRFGKQIRGKIRKRIDFRSICNYVRNENIEFVYIRSYHNANPFTQHMIKQFRKSGARIVLEIPTYPYDKEYTSLRMNLDLLIDRCFRHQLAKNLDAIITYSEVPEIFGAPTINISNGIDFDNIRLKKQVNDTSKELHMVGVAEVHYWHGFDRLIKGLVGYYSNSPEYKVYFHIVGKLTGERERQDILPVIRENNLEPYVILHGALFGEDLDNIFENSDFAIGSLARHRSGIKSIKTLKNREYAARGIPFVYSETDSDFDNQPYILKVDADEAPIDINRVIKFYHNQKWDSMSIRQSVSHLSWKNQMQVIINKILN